MVKRLESFLSLLFFILVSLLAVADAVVVLVHTQLIGAIADAEKNAVHFALVQFQPQQIYRV